MIVLFYLGGISWGKPKQTFLPCGSVSLPSSCMPKPWQMPEVGLVAVRAVVVAQSVLDSLVQTIVL